VTSPASTSRGAFFGVAEELSSCRCADGDGPECRENLVLGLGGASDSVRTRFSSILGFPALGTAPVCFVVTGGYGLQETSWLGLAELPTLCPQEVGAHGYARIHVRTLCQYGKPTGPDGGVRGRRPV